MWGCLVNEAFIVMKLGCNGAVMAVRMSVDWDFSAFVISKQIFCGPPGGGQSIFFFSKSKSLDLCFNMKDDCQSMTGLPFG